jgi:hypothetical protein
MSVHALPVAAILAGLVATHAPAAAGPALGSYTVSGPVAHGNLAAYFVHRGGGAPAPLALHQAMASGAAQITASRNALPRVSNFSDRPILVPAGTLLKGGVQDQVVVSSVTVPPRAIDWSIPTLCVENGRSEPRHGDDSTRYTTTGVLLPSQVGRLSMLTSAPESRAAMHLHQIGVWLAVDSIRSRLSERLGVAIASPRSPSSLPLALENPLVEQAQQPFLTALQHAGEQADDISGAVFAIDGELVAADLYASNDLFRQMWPSLLRAYAVQSLMAPNGGAASALPSIESVKAFLRPASQNRGQVRMIASYDGWVHMGHAANAPSGATGLERVVLKLLATRALDAERAGALTRQQVVHRVLAEIEKQGEDSQAAMQQANRAGLFNEPPVSPLIPAQASDTASRALPVLAALVLLLGLRRPIVHRMMRSMRNAVLRLWALLCGPVPATDPPGSWRPAQSDCRRRERTILSPCGHVPLVRGAVALPQPQNVRTPNVRSSLLVDA